jgi:hypothetical protein
MRMKIPLEAVVQLLHESPQASLATLSQSLPGYPFASALPFAVDDTQAPVFLISRLAEHTRNLSGDARASLLIQTREHPQPEASPRLTLLGDATAFDPQPALIRRYLRYHPDAERYLNLGDFGFFRFVPRRMRLIAGFGQMGWVETEEWQQVLSLPLDMESELLKDCHPGNGLIGLDCYGMDKMMNGARERISFPRAVQPDQIRAMLVRLGLCQESGGRL